MSKDRSNTGENQPKKKMPKGQPFVKGDPRINRKGRPKSFDQLRALFQDIASEQIEITQAGKKIKITRAQAIGMAMSMDKKLMRDFLEFAFGKVPQKVEHEGDVTMTWKELMNADEDPDAEASGKQPRSIHS